MEKLITHLKQHGNLSQADIALFSENLTSKDFTTGDIFIEAGKTAHKVGFVLSGVFRYFFYDREGNEITSVFMAENQFVLKV